MYNNKEMAVLAATSTFIQIAKLTERHEHYNLTEMVKEYIITIFCDDEERLFEIVDNLRNARYFEDEGQLDNKNYLQNTKTYTIEIKFPY